MSKQYYVGMNSPSGAIGHYSHDVPLDINNPRVGIEFECIVDMDTEVSDAIKTAFAFKSLDFYPDTDCSLPSHSVELISKPVEFRKVVGFNSSWKKFLKRAEDFVTEMSCAGMHINISETDDRVGLRACWLGNGMWNLGKLVAGIGDEGSWNEFKFTHSPNYIYYKGDACAWRGNRVEFRFPRTTSNWKKFQLQTLYSKSLLDAGRAAKGTSFEDEREMMQWYLNFLEGNKGKYKVLRRELKSLLATFSPDRAQFLSTDYRRSSSDDLQPHERPREWYDYDEEGEEEEYDWDDYDDD